VIRDERKQLELPAVLSLGSNLGDREATIRGAVAELAAAEGVRVTKASGLVETPALKPDGVDESAPPYLNAAVAIKTTLSPERLLETVNEIERRFGRERTERWGDRTLDIDIVAMGGLERSTAELTIPHPRATLRAFVLAPWLDLEPDAHIPGHGRVDELLAATGDVVTRVEAEPLL
jgi:2-amino-4-hydroxy-6-hydroxymethyldihydropteridine diphosphokinase